MKTAKLLLHCPDQPGILAEVTDFITVNKGNIIYLDQYVDHVENIFFHAYRVGIGKLSGSSREDRGLFLKTFVCAEVRNEFSPLFFGCQTAYGYFRVEDVALPVRSAGALYGR